MADRGAGPAADRIHSATTRLGAGRVAARPAPALATQAIQWRADLPASAALEICPKRDRRRVAAPAPPRMAAAPAPRRTAAAPAPRRMADPREARRACPMRPRMHAFPT